MPVCYLHVYLHVSDLYPASKFIEVLLFVDLIDVVARNHCSSLINNCFDK